MPAFVAPLLLTNQRTPSIARRSERRRPRPQRCATDDDFVLPSLSRDLLGVDPSSANEPTTVREFRLSQKRAEIEKQQRRALELRDDDDEARRAQLAGEQLSAADLFGVVPDTPDIPPPLPRRTKPSVKKGKAPSPSGSAPKPTLNRPLAHPTPQHSFTSDQHFLIPGAIVSHSRHGFGRFRGLERTVSKSKIMQNSIESSVPTEFAIIEYRDGDVYVPLAHLDLLSRVSSQNIPPRLDSINVDQSHNFRAVSTMRRRRMKHVARVKTRENIRQQLVNLNALYSSRLKLRRRPFPVNVEAERLLDQSCTFDLTDDQVRATNEALNDLSNSWKPMDRLLCGDVGFGKTEVAIRAAFRVLSAGMQVAFLTPTTILAHQHYETISERLSHHFPEIQTACLTRFTKRKDLIEYRRLLSTGEMSFVVGTHILLSKNLSIKTLGLLICDEEHRWGVNQKERLRERYSGVDTLFLSATPIPRTLHLALSGLKDTSVLSKPPPGRKAVVTRIAQPGAGVVRNAIQKELDRRGQVFYVVPRIDGIEDIADWLRDLIPNLRVQVAHGSASDLEHRVWSFAQYQHDVLVCTTVIENGINLPKVNTLIVEDAGRFGLAQLHQLRGRVGRCNLQAYAWLLFTHSPGGVQTEASKRMAALEKHSQLGAGFIIAQKDMEMRGVGTVLGIEQHGNNSVNAEEYAEMLAEELAFARTGEPVPLSLPKADRCEVFLPVASYIPRDYISDPELKMIAYSSMSSAQTIEELKSVTAMLQSKFGNMPTSVRLHLSVLEVKLLAKSLGISKVYSERQHVILEWCISIATFKYLINTVVDDRVRQRFEHLEDVERVVVRGLGVCEGDIQLAKMREYLIHFADVCRGIQARKPSSITGALLGEDVKG